MESDLTSLFDEYLDDETLSLFRSIVDFETTSERKAYSSKNEDDSLHGEFSEFSTSISTVPSPLDDSISEHSVSSATLPYSHCSHTQRGTRQLQRPSTHEHSKHETADTLSSGTAVSAIYHQTYTTEHNSHRIERRREQNRASQRRFRAAKEVKIKEAQMRSTTLVGQLHQSGLYNQQLEQQLADLQEELDRSTQHSLVLMEYAGKPETNL